MEFQPLQFFNEQIYVEFSTLPLLQKKPICPKYFFWRNNTFEILEVISEWRDYTRHGRMAKNMQPKHAEFSAHRGSWGVGTIYFRVYTNQDRYFDLFYDRAPKDADDRKGNWFLYRELKPIQGNVSS